jgi:hypothetical protein
LTTDADGVAGDQTQFGKSMNARLTNDDSCAVDLLLERGHQPNGNGGMTGCFTTAPSADLQQRLTRVEQILHLLNYYTVPEPASDLVARTLARCDRAAGLQPHPGGPAPGLGAPAR